MKTCTKCREIKELDQFPKDKTTKSGIYPNCRTCVNKRNLENYKANPQKYINLQNIRNKSNPEIKKSYDVSRYKNNTEEFKSRSSIHYKTNSEKINAKRREKHKEDPSKNREQHLKNKYGITLEEYNEMFKVQQGKCLLCNRHQTELSKTLAVDHSHETGEIRGLLCSSCNLLIGLAKESREVLIRAADYVQR